jgi:hypothetical protein
MRSIDIVKPTEPLKKKTLKPRAIEEKRRMREHRDRQAY